VKYSDEFKDYAREAVGRGFSLLENIEFQKNKEGLLEIIQNIWSAARIEGAEDIAYFAEVVMKLVKSTLTGGIPLKADVRNILSESFKELEYASQQESRIKDKNIRDVKALFENLKSEEKDYIVLKKIKVLYIDEDTFSHYKVKRNSDKFIEIIPCLSAEDGLSKLSSGKYDVILCDFRPSDPIVGDIFSFYSSRFPIVAISSSDNPRDAQTATRMGALDYIPKNEEGLKWISRSLHTAFHEWQKRKDIKRQNAINQRAKKILKHLLNDTHSIKQAVDSQIRIVSESGRIIREIEDTDNKDIDSLVVSNYLSKDRAESAFSCPRCHSSRLRVHFICQNCRISDFVKGEVIEHNKCGYSDLEENFVERSKEDKMICPKCNKDLRLIGVDYFRLESAFKCRHCRIVFSTPLQEYDCTECNLSGIKLQELAWSAIHMYSLNPTMISEIKRNLIILDDIGHFLEGEGFKVTADYKTELKQETIGPFDFVALKGNDIVVIMSLGSDVEESYSKLVQMDSVDKLAAIGASVTPPRISKYAILFSDPQEIVTNLMNKFGVIPVIIDDTSKILEKFKEVFMVSFILH
jgi:DNA-binding NarL/FixJ family response regulator